MSLTTPVLKIMTDSYPQLSASHQQLVDVILRDPETAAFYNVAELAIAANVSDATVTRFARALGYNGFPELSRELQGVVRLRLTTKERLEKTKSAEHNHPDNLLSQSVEDDINNLQMFLDELDVKGLEFCAKHLVDARIIGIVCSRSTLSLGLFFQFYLNFLGKETLLIDGEPRTVDSLAKLRAGQDVVIGIGFSRYSQFTLNCLTYLQQNNMTSFVITDYPSSPLAKYATKSFYCPTGIASHMDSLVAPLALVQALLRQMSAALYTDSMDNLSRLEEVWNTLGIYYKSE